MKAYKLLRVRKDGTIGSLFINRKMRIPIGKWLVAEKGFFTKGFAYRPFYHCSAMPIAPHLSKKKRKWYIVEMKCAKEMKRPKSQGGLWYLAEKIRIVCEYKKI
jgi:hypothetical protein